MADQIVYVLVYSHKHGEDITVYATSEGAHAGLAGIAREWWGDMAEYDDDVPDSPDGLTDEEVIEIYFERMDDESYEIATSAIFD